MSKSGSKNYRGGTLIVGLSVATLLALPQRVPAQSAPDHFLCYRSKTARGTEKFDSRPGTRLVDQFGAVTVGVVAQERLCTPTNKNGEDPTAPFHPDHLDGYHTMNEVPHFIPARSLEVSNQFGTIVVDAMQPDRLLLPTAKSLTASPAPPVFPAVDHFSCYRARVSRGTPGFVPMLGVRLEDQFGEMIVDVRKPKKLCAPVNKNDEEPGAESHPDHLLCYTIKRAAGSPPFVTVSPIFVNNQFGPLTLDARKPAELCVPSLKRTP